MALEDLCNVAPMWKTSCRQKYLQGSGLQLIGNIRENIGKYQQILAKFKKKYKNIHFFQIFKHLKQQQHQINTLPHKYEKKTYIYDV